MKKPGGKPGRQLSFERLHMERERSLLPEWMVSFALEVAPMDVTAVGRCHVCSRTVSLAMEHKPLTLCLYPQVLLDFPRQS